MQALGVRVGTTTNVRLMPYLVDTILNSNVVFQRIVNAAEKFEGERLRFPVKYAVNSTGTSYSGFTPLSTSATTNRVNMEFFPSFYQITSALPGDELSTAESAGDAKVMDLVGVTLKSDMQDMADALGTIFYADGTGNGGLDPLGLAALIDDGTTAATIGGLARATYTTLKSTVTASGGTLSLAKMGALWNSATSGSIQPTIAPTTKTIFNLYEQLLTPQERIQKGVAQVKGIDGSSGFTTLSYKGIGVLADEKCTSGQLIFMNENFMDWYGMKHFDGEPVQYKATIEGNDYSDVMGLGFSFSGWIKPANADAIIAHTYFGGQLITENPKRHSKLTAILGV